MIDIPLGKALVAVETEKITSKCGECFLNGMQDMFCDEENDNFIGCVPPMRKDGKNVIFKMVDLPKGREKNI